MVPTPFLWICLVSLFFWSFYEKFDSKRNQYIDHPLATFLYFLFASCSILIIYPDVLQIYALSPLSIFLIGFTLMITYAFYKILPKHYAGPSETFAIDHKYWKLLNTRYILPKFCEIIFQQTFFSSILILIVSNYADNPYAYVIGTAVFIVAHIPLFFLTNAKIGEYYLIWSIFGAPIFAYMIIATNNIWYAIIVHTMFYTSLSTISWLVSPKKVSS